MPGRLTIKHYKFRHPFSADTHLSDNLPFMTEIKKYLAEFKASLRQEVQLAELYARNNTVHKWKGPFRTLILREALAWRMQDLLEQSLLLSTTGGLLGARILLRSAFETLAVLVYLNKAMRSVVAGTLNYHDFCTKTSRLLVGSRDQTTSVESINVMSMLQSADKRYPGLNAWYAELSESAHPNYEGVVLGYTRVDHSSQITTFENRWRAMYGDTHHSALVACLKVFVAEYNDEWSDAFDSLEAWIETHDKELESSKRMGEDTSRKDSA